MLTLDDYFSEILETREKTLFLYPLALHFAKTLFAFFSLVLWIDNE